MATPLSGFWFLSPAEDDPNGRTRTNRSFGQGDFTPRLVSREVPAADTELLDRVRGGEAEAFRAIYLEHYTAAWETAYGYLHTEAAAEDVVHDVFLQIWRARAKWRLRGSIKAYILGAIRHKALNLLRHERVIWRDADREGAAGTGSVLSTPPAAPDDLAYAHELDHALVQLLETMPPLRREVVTLRWRQDFGIAEIAAVLGISVNAVSIHLSRARETLLPVLRQFERR